MVPNQARTIQTQYPIHTKYQAILLLQKKRGFRLFFNNMF